MPAAAAAKREGLKLSRAAAVQIVDTHPELITPSGVTWEAHQKKIKELTMPEALTVTLNKSLTMSVVEHVDYNTGAITYMVKGKRLSGTVTLSPCYSDNTETTPSQLWVEAGRRPSEPEQHDAKQQPGARGFLNLVDRRAHKNMSISVWDTADDMLAAERHDGHFKRLSHHRYAAGDIVRVLPDLAPEALLLLPALLDGADQRGEERRGSRLAQPRGVRGF